MGPIPPPAKLPPKWKCAKDKYGRPYYYHVKIRKSQWEPPPPPEPTAMEEAECKCMFSDVFFLFLLCFFMETNTITKDLYK